MTLSHEARLTVRLFSDHIVTLSVARAYWWQLISNVECHTARGTSLSVESTYRVEEIGVTPANIYNVFTLSSCRLGKEAP